MGSLWVQKLFTDQWVFYESSTDERSLMDRLGEMIDDSLESMRVGDRLTMLSESASQANEHIVSLIAIADGNT